MELNYSHVELYLEKDFFLGSLLRLIISGTSIFSSGGVSVCVSSSFEDIRNCNFDIFVWIAGVPGV